MPIFQLKLLERETIANSTIRLSFEKPEGFNYLPGQYGGFTLIDPPEKDDGGITRRFSLLSSPLDASIQIATRIQASAFKRVLHELPIGSHIKFAGPTGKFTLHEDASIPAVMIAGGIGIAPFYSMIRHAVQTGSNQSITLFYGNQTRSDAALLSELEEMASSHEPFKLIAAMDKPDPEWQGETGFITKDMLAKYISDIFSPVYYVCGSPTMVTTIQEMLAEMGIDEDKINVEDFPGY